jgi:hypothetical protein
VDPDKTQLIGAIAQEYLSVIDRLRWGEFTDKREQRWLEGQRALLHQQLVELTGRQVTVQMARQLAARSR